MVVGCFVILGIMAKHITDPANRDYDFGYEFNYDVWTADTTLTLTNVPWNNDYRDTVWFENDTALNNYIDARESTNINITNASYARVGEPVKINIPFNRATKYNYLRATNPAQPVPGGDTPASFYYFITGVYRSAPNTTTVTVELDVWQTFIRHISFGRCYIERGHLGIAASNAFSNYGRDHLTIPEPIDTGAEMVTISHETRKIARAFDTANGSADYQLFNYDVLIVSTTDLTVPYDPDELEVKTATGDGAQFMMSGASLYVMPAVAQSGLDFFDWMHQVSIVPWIAQGIVSVTLIPKVSRYHPGFTYDGSKPTKATQAYFAPLQYDMKTNWRNHADIVNKIPSRYRHLKKFFTFPYMAVELTCSTGTPVILRPEAWNQPNARLMERIAIMPPNQRVVFYPRGYNSTETSYESLHSGSLPGISGRSDGDDGGDYLGVFTQITGLPQVPAVNDNAALAVANNTHGTAAARSAAVWTSEKARMAAGQAENLAMGGIGAGQSASALGRSGEGVAMADAQAHQRDMLLLNSLAGIGGGAAGGIVGGVPGVAIGAAAGAGSALVNSVSLGMNQGAATRQQNIAHNTQMGVEDIQAQYATRVANSNRYYADRAQAGDYMQAVAAIDAQVQDMMMTPPSMLGQYGGDTLNFVHDGLGVSIRWKMIDQSAIARVGEFWLRYGYALHRFGTLPPNLMVMSKFTYWKLAETYITSAPMPEFFKQAIRGILEKGVTVWADANDIGNIDPATNMPLTGITL